MSNISKHTVNFLKINSKLLKVKNLLIKLYIQCANLNY